MNNFAAIQPTSTSYIPSVFNSEYKLSDLMAIFPQRTIKKGTYIIRMGQAQKDIYYLESGKVLSLTSYQEMQKELSNGYILDQQFINLNALRNNQSAEQSVLALSNLKIRTIPLLAFHSFMRKNPYLNQIVVDSLICQANMYKKFCHQILLLSSNQRIIHFLIDYVAEAGSRVGYEWVVREFFTQRQIAQLTNTARQTVSTLLNELRRQNIIHFTKKYLIIRELEKLKKMAKEV